jgi:hypothetical protein
MLQQFGHPLATVVFVAALIGPMQVVGRIGEMRFARHAAPQCVGKITFATLPAALLALLFLGTQQWAVAAFCVLYGLSNGILTIVRGTVPQALFGSKNYGAISGAMAGPAMAAKAAGPLAIATIVAFTHSPYPLLGVLLAISAMSLLFYLAAINAPRRQTADADDATPSPHQSGAAKARQQLPEPPINAPSASESASRPVSSASRRLAALRESANGRSHPSPSDRH